MHGSLGLSDGPDSACAQGVVLPENWPEEVTFLTEPMNVTSLVKTRDRMCAQDPLCAARLGGGNSHNFYSRPGLTLLRSRQWPSRGCRGGALLILS